MLLSIWIYLQSLRFSGFSGFSAKTIVFALLFLLCFWGMQLEFLKAEDCPCKKDVDNLRRAQKKAQEEGVSSSRRIYRIKKEFYITREMIARALNCACAGDPQTVENDGSDIPLLGPSEVGSNCQDIVKVQLDFNFAQQMALEDVNRSIRRMAVRAGANAIVIDSYLPEKGISAKLLKCGDNVERSTSDRFVKLEGRVYDRRNNLSWQYCSRGQELVGDICKNEPLPGGWNPAKRYCRGLPPIDGRYWRLPKADELLSLVFQSVKPGTGPRIDKSVFPQTLPEVYWTKDTYWTQLAVMAVDFESGRKIVYGSDELAYVRCAIDLPEDADFSSDADSGSDADSN